jgi:hypothetical protein
LERGNQLPEENVIDALPPEVLMMIFSFLDEISLFSVGNVCRRWNQILTSQTTQDQWFDYTRRRWPLFSPMILINDWFSTYSALIESSFCRNCIYQISEEIPHDLAMVTECEWHPVIDTRQKRVRKKRLTHAADNDAPEGNFN